MGILDSTIKNVKLIFRFGFVTLVLGILLAGDPKLLSMYPERTVKDITIIVLSIANVSIMSSLLVYVLTNQDQITTTKMQNQVN